MAEERAARRLARWQTAGDPETGMKEPWGAHITHTAMALSSLVATRHYLLGLNVPLHVPFVITPLIEIIQGVLFIGTGVGPDGCVAVGCAVGGDPGA